MLFKRFLTIAAVLTSMPSASIGATAPPTATSIVFLGDSVTAGFGLTEADAYPAQLALLAQGQTPPLKIINAGVSGDTTQGGLGRIDWILKQKPQWVVIALGANDMMRGVSPDATKKNLIAIVQKIKASGSKPALLGMKAMPNFGKDFANRFNPIYAQVARAEKIPLLEFFMEDVAGRPKLNQGDGIHPNPEGQKLIAKRVWRFIRGQL